jgi:hypothetical protein
MVRSGTVPKGEFHNLGRPIIPGHEFGGFTNPMPDGEVAGAGSLVRA